MLSKNNRLSKKDFEIAFKKKGKFVRLGFLTFKITENSQNIIRFGISCGTKISKKAVMRNKVKRRLNESLRLNLNKVSRGYDILIMPSPEIVKKNYQEIDQLILMFFKQSGLLN